jgi:hypothetical protein
LFVLYDETEIIRLRKEQGVHDIKQRRERRPD